MDQEQRAEAQRVYASVAPVRRIVNAYSAVIPWGGAVLRAGPDEACAIAFPAADVVRDLLITGLARAEARADERSAEVEFTYEGDGERTPVSVVASVAQAYERVAGLPGVPPQYLETLLGHIGTGTSCPLWMVDVVQVRDADPSVLMSELFHFLSTCDRYRQAIAYDLREAFGGDVSWAQDLWAEESPMPVLQYAPTHRAFCDALGIDLRPLRSWAQKYADALGPILTSAEATGLRSAFAPCPPAVRAPRKRPD